MLVRRCRADDRDAAMQLRRADTPPSPPPLAAATATATALGGRGRADGCSLGFWGAELELDLELAVGLRLGSLLAARCWRPAGRDAVCPPCPGPAAPLPAVAAAASRVLPDAAPRPGLPGPSSHSRLRPGAAVCAKMCRRRPGRSPPYIYTAGPPRLPAPTATGHDNLPRHSRRPARRRLSSRCLPARLLRLPVCPSARLPRLPRVAPAPAEPPRDAVDPLCELRGPASPS